MSASTVTTMEAMQKPQSAFRESLDDSWASEALPMAVRRELLERELKKLGFRRKGGSGRGSVQQQQQSQPSSGSHPQADSPSPDGHGG